MTSDFARLVDIPLVQSLIDRLWHVWNIPMGIVDTCGTVLAGAGWSEFCARFHRKNPDAFKHCQAMEAFFSEQLNGREQGVSGRPYEYRCGNGLVDLEAPIVFEGRHLGNLYLGQFFYEEPEPERFRLQARRYGFDEASYLENLGKVPVVPPERVAELICSLERMIALLVRKGRQAQEMELRLKEMERRQAHLLRQNRELRQLRLVQAASGQDESALRETLASAMRVLELSRVALWVEGAGRDEFSCALVLAEGWGEAPSGAGPWPGACDSLWMAELRAGRAVLCEAGFDLEEETGEPGGSSRLDVPLGAEQGLCGVLCCERPAEAGRWLSDDLEYASATAEYLAVLITGEGMAGSQRESELRYRLLFNAETDAIVIFDGDSCRIVEANESAAKLYGWSRRRMAGMHMDELSAEPEATRLRLADISSGLLRRIPLAMHRSRSGAVFPVEVSCGAFPWKGRELFTAIIRDISERRQLSKLKDDMLSAVSHEIRTPLTAIIGFADVLLKNEMEPAQQRDYLQIIASQGERLKELVDNLLDLQRFRAGFGMVNPASIPVRQLLESAVLPFYQSTSRRPFILSCPEGTLAVRGDERHLQRALTNLVSNAHKYSPEGTDIALGASIDGPCVTLWVRDQGEGIAPHLQEQIFDRFFRISQGDGQPIGGTGLGLSLVKAIAEGHGGRVWVESTPGLGSTFFLSLPAATA